MKKGKSNLFFNLRFKSKSCFKQRASLTIEAALILPVFLYFMIIFLYYIQIFTVQEQIQAAITKMGLNLSKSAYVMKDFPDLDDKLNFDFSIFGDDFDINLSKLTDELASGYVLKLYARKYLDTNQINGSCIKNGFDGLDFMSSSLISSEDYTDILVTYYIEIPIKLFSLSDMKILQRVRLRNWTGYAVNAAYEKDEEENETATVFITDTGSVYHMTDTCSHIKLSVTAVQGVPTNLRNENGAKYYPCESCSDGELELLSTFYITSDGTRYHTRRDCSRIKRSVNEIPITEVEERTPCKRCYK